MSDDVVRRAAAGDSLVPAGEPLGLEILLSLTRVTGGWLRRRHVFQYVPDPPAGALAVALCSHTAPVDSLMVDDQREPMCPGCLDIVMDRYVDRGGLDRLVHVLCPPPQIGEPGVAPPA